MTLYQANVPTLMRYSFVKHTPKLIIFGTHNLQTFTHNTLVNKLLLMQFYVFNIRPKFASSEEMKITRHTACQQKKHACVIFGMPFERLKHANCILESFEYF